MAKNERWLRPGMSPAESLARCATRIGYYDHIAAQLVRHVRAHNPRWRTVLDIMGRTGYCAWKALPFAERVVITEDRPSFVEHLKRTFSAEKNVDIITGPLLEAIGRVGSPFDVVLCCEQLSQLPVQYADAVRKIIQHGQPDVIAFGATLGPSHHKFSSLRVADHRTGVVKPGEIMSELSHPIHRAAHARILQIARGRYGFRGDSVYPEPPKPFDLPAIRQANEDAGFRNFALIEELFPVPGTHISDYLQNGRTFFFRYEPLSLLPEEDQIAILLEAEDHVEGLPEYPEMLKVVAQHPVAYIIAF